MPTFPHTAEINDYPLIKSQTQKKGLPGFNIFNTDIRKINKKLNLRCLKDDKTSMKITVVF